MIITLQLKSLSLDFEMDDEPSVSKEEQARITQQQIETPVSIEVPVENFREYFHLDTVQDWACDVISERSGYCVEDFAFA